MGKGVVRATGELVTFPSVPHESSEKWGPG